jgi:hypothetical protein
VFVVWKLCKCAGGAGVGSGLGPLLLLQDTAPKDPVAPVQTIREVTSSLPLFLRSTAPDPVRLVGHDAVWEGDMTVVASIPLYNWYRHGRGARYARGIFFYGSGSVTGLLLPVRATLLVPDRIGIRMIGTCSLLAGFLYP